METLKQISEPIHKEKKQGRGGKRLLASLLCVALFLEGCGVPENLRHLPFLKTYVEKASQQEQSHAYEGPAGMGVTDIDELQAPTGTPMILTDRLGYLPDSDKTCMLLGEHVPDTFQVLDVETKEVVYEGPVTRKDRQDPDGSAIAYGYFHELKTEGKYMIRCDGIGYSYPFEINEKIYEDSMNELMDRMREAINLMSGDALMTGGLGERDPACGNVMTACQMCSILLLSYEFYPDYYGQYLEGISSGVRVPSLLEIIRNNADWLFTMQDPVSGGVYGGKRDPGGSGTVQDASGLELSVEATALYAATLAKFAYLYQYYDASYTNKCIRAAELAYRYMNGHEGGSTCFNEWYYATAELYRLTGSYVYQNALTDAQEGVLQAPEEAYRYLADVTYLTTQRKVDRDLCGKLTDRLMKNGEKISAMCSHNGYLVAVSETENEVGDLLWNMTCLSIVNYVITNHEYITHLENNLHYLMGSNRYSKSVLPNQIPAPSLKSAVFEEEDQALTDLTLTEAAQLLMLFVTVTAERDPITGT